MPAFAYPITIRRENLVIHYDEIVEISSNSLTLDELSFVGSDKFSIQELKWEGYEISVKRTRLETDDERNRRVAKEEAYMAEYRRCHP